MVVFNAALVAFIAWLVRFQVRFHHAAWREDGAPPPTGAVGGYVKTLDVFADGASFFSANIFFILVLSTTRLGGVGGAWGLPALVLFAAVLSCICAALAAVEAPVKRALLRLGRLNPVTRRQVHTINDWYTGQWAWLLGYAYWFILWSLVTSSYFGCFDCYAQRRR
eukprot:gene8553-172_t